MGQTVLFFQHRGFRRPGDRRFLRHRHDVSIYNGKNQEHLSNQSVISNCSQIVYEKTDYKAHKEMSHDVVFSLQGNVYQSIYLYAVIDNETDNTVITKYLNKIIVRISSDSADNGIAIGTVSENRIIPP